MKRLAVAAAVLAWTQIAAAAPEPSFRQVIPAAASTSGHDGAHWRTDLTVFNPSDTRVFITLELIPSSTGGAAAAALSSPLQPRQSVTVADVLATNFPSHATGALVVVGRDAEGGPVPIIASSRTWSPAADEVGSVGQGLPGVPWSADGDLSQPVRIHADLEATDAFRSNLGFVNLSQTLEATFEVEVSDALGFAVGNLNLTLAPWTRVQRNGILADLGLEGAGYTAVVRRVTEGGLDFITYASRIDRTTNDPSYIGAQLEITAIGPPRMRLVPAVASTSGAGGSLWQTDLTIHNPASDDSLLAWLDLIPTGPGGSADRPPFSIAALGPGQTVTLEDVLGARFPGYTTGAIVVRAYSGSQLGDARVTSRTWTPSGSGAGSVGQGIPAVAMSPASDPVVITGLEASAAFRSNLGLVNPTRNLELTLEVEILDAAGVSRGVARYTLGPWAHMQVNGILDAFGLAGTDYTAVVRLAGSDNLLLNPSEPWEPIFVAYGSRVDQLTNDPTYLSASRLAAAQPADTGDWFDFEATTPWYLCPEEPFPEEATVVRAFDQTYHWWGAENWRTRVEEVEFPAPGDWNQVGLLLHLECPESGLCDHWDRTGSLQLVLNPEEPQEDWQYLEIMRHITPYRIEMCEYVDVTPLASLLQGRQTLVSWIDTWVGPGHSSGEGWRISYDFVFYPGPPRQADEVINVWGRRSITLGYTDPDRDIDSQINPVTVAIPADATRVEARLTTTGHAFGNTDNCAEFCVLWQDLVVNGSTRSVLPWRTDCEHNPHSPQQGTWKYDRNGWCPGAIVPGHTVDITDLVTPGEDAVLDFDVLTFEGEEYENTDPADADPYQWVSLQVLVYRNDSR